MIYIIVHAARKKSCMYNIYIACSKGSLDAFLSVSTKWVDMKTVGQLNGDKVGV